MDVWQFRIRTLRKLARGWALNEVARLNKEKVELTLEYNHLDMESETRPLTKAERTQMKCVEEKLNRIGL